MWTVISSKAVHRKLNTIPNPEKTRIILTLKKLENGPDNLDIKAMSGMKGYRLRIGKWRLLIDINYEQKSIYIRTLDSRGEIYKNKNK